MCYRTPCKPEGIYWGIHQTHPKSSERVGDVADLSGSLHVHLASSSCREQDEERQVTAAAACKELQPSQGSFKRRSGDRDRGGPGLINLVQQTYSTPRAS